MVDLEAKENKLKLKRKEIIQKFSILFSKEFSIYRVYFQKFFRVIAEIDCLLNLYRFQINPWFKDLTLCRPELFIATNKVQSFITIEKGIHPVKYII